MEEQWIKNLRERYADKKEPAPDGLWEDIEAIMAERSKAKVTMDGSKSKAKTVTMWTRRIAIAAACVLMIVGASVLFFNNTENRLASNINEETESIESNAQEIKDANEEDNDYEEERLPVQNNISDKFLSMADKAIDRQKDIAEEETRNITDESSNIAEQVETTDSTLMKKENGTSMPVKYNSKNYYAENKSNGSVPVKKQKNRETSFSLYGTNLPSFNVSADGNGSQNMYMAVNSPFLSSDAVLMSYSPSSVDAIASSDEVNVNHRLPLKVGVSARFKITDRIGVESGIMYTYLTSDIESGDEKGGYKSTQKLHYVGVPIKASYDLWQTDVLTLYAGIGGAVEFCVDGNYVTDYYSGNKVVSTSEYEIKDNRPQFSLNASAGLQYNINDVIGIYAEPGLNYYIDNGTSVDNIYKDKPWNFSLNLGLRFTFE
ncbi:MAG: outer membrane beta-barrel protein [Prevotellaceae bacterium]|nr:outer membrane beta-barrel protein [Prevotellaceae bacterium]